MEIKKITFVGTGAWATGLANIVSNNGYEVCMYGICKEEVDDINTNHKNSKYFGDLDLNNNIYATTDLHSAIKNAGIVCVAVPSKAIGSVVSNINNVIEQEESCKEVIIVNVTKGFYQNGDDFQTMIDFISSNITSNKIKKVVSLVGPSFASEVVSGEFTAVCAVSKSLEYAQVVQNVFSNNRFRVYTNTDEIGCEVCASLKNVIAIASGILHGLGYKYNTQAAIITRGLAEISRFVNALGGNTLTCLGLTGMGDLLLTCSSPTSRNYTFGTLVGKNNGVEGVFDGKTTIEGIDCCKLSYEMSIKYDIYSPIINAMYNIIFNKAKVDEEMEKLVTSPLKQEKYKI